MIRSPERIEFLTEILTGAVEHAGYGFIEPIEYEWENTPNPYALVVDRYDEENPDTQYRIDLDLIAKGLGIIKRAVLQKTPVVTKTFLQGTEDEATYQSGGETVLHNATTGQRLYMSVEQRRNIMLADRTNHDEGDLDVLDYLAIVECGLFGAVTYG